MFNTLEKLFITDRVLIPGYTIPVWHPETTTITSIPWGYDSSGVKVTYQHPLPITSTYFSYWDNIALGVFPPNPLEPGQSQVSTQSFGTGWVQIRIVGWNTTTNYTPGYFTYDIQPDTYIDVYSPDLGWNSSARSIKSIVGDGQATFSVKGDCIGVVIGLSLIDQSIGSSYFDILYGIHLDHSRFQVVEAGIIKGIYSFYSELDTFKIVRSNSVVYYYINDILFYTSTIPSYGEVVLDTSLYAAGDYVTSPTLLDATSIGLASITFLGTSSFSLTPEAAVTFSATSSFRNTTYSIDNDVYLNHQNLVSTSSFGIIDRQMNVNFNATSSLLATLDPSFLQMSCTMSPMTSRLTSGYSSYASIDVGMKGMTAVLRESEFSSSISIINSSMLPMTSGSHSIIGGTTLPSTLTMSPMTARLADHSYSEIIVSMSSMEGLVVSLPQDVRDIGHKALIMDYIYPGDSSLTNYLMLIEEAISTISSLSTKVNTSSLITELLNSIDQSLVLYLNSISETISLSSTFVDLGKGLEILTELVVSSESLSSKVFFLNVLSNSLSLLDSNLFGLQFNIAESVLLVDTSIGISKLLNQVVESINLSHSFSENTVAFLPISESILTSSDSISSALLKAVVSEQFLIVIAGAKGQDTYLAYSLAPETNSISTYSNYNFNGCIRFANKYLFYNETGLYEYGGAYDAGQVVTSYIQTIAYNFGTSNIKQVPAVYLGVSNSDAVILKVNVDGKADIIYKLNKRTHNLQTQKIDVGKGVIGRYFEFEIISSADQFNLESIEFFPVVLKRKI